MPYFTEKLNCSEDAILTELQDLQKRIARLNFLKTIVYSFFNPPEDDKTINRIAKIITQQTTLKPIKLMVVHNNTSDQTTITWCLF